MADFQMTVSHAAEYGTRRDLLVALRRRLVGALEDERTQPRDLSPLVLRLRELAAELEAIDLLDQKPADPAEVEDGDFDADDV